MFVSWTSAKKAKCYAFFPSLENDQCKMWEFYFYSIFGPLFFFPWQKKKGQKLGSVHRAMWQKWVHILKRRFVRQTFFFLALLHFEHTVTKPFFSWPYYILSIQLQILQACALLLHITHSVACDHGDWPRLVPGDWLQFANSIIYVIYVHNKAISVV